MLLLAPALTYVTKTYNEAELQRWQKTGTIKAAHYAFNQEVPLRYDYHLDSLRCLESVPPALMLIIHGRNDEVVPIENSRKYATSYPSQTQLVEVDSDLRLNDQLDLIWKYARTDFEIETLPKGGR